MIPVKVVLKVFTRILLVLAATPLILAGFLVAASVFAMMLGRDLFDEYIRP